MDAAGGSVAAAASAPPGHTAALVWFRPGDLRLADHEPLHSAACLVQQQPSHKQQQQVPPPLLLPFACLDARELAAGEGSRLGIPALGPHRLRLLLEATASVRASLRRRHSDLLWQAGSPEALVGRLVALAAGAGATRLSLHHYLQPGERSARLEDAVAAAFSTAAEQHGAPGCDCVVCAACC